ncbi:putative NADH-ubiquinone oxidoreductase 21 kDa subunit [Trichodelitschia bisporula]|uniref:Putative NADH-ubiquinone oxidoreductase 21 kDa subunit n=1 Tax=Trichodelitschia bisporula TaxID=703511 RepID=A0A6G1HRC5_9PEZI|nr:putative NADH-ubiquinone oxidoreductase 21 kDa subunit [Trichodelitschia bisporula]
MATQTRAVVPTRRPTSDYALIDNDPHFKRVVGYFRPSDYAVGAGTATLGPLAMLLMEKVSPSYVGRGGFAPIMRLNVAVGVTAGFLLMYERSASRFYGVNENAREVEMDMREMVDKAKRGEPLYGESQLSEHLQGVAARNSRYSSLFLHIVPWFNFVNHNQHGVDTAKYYQQAERELEAERLSKRA